MRRIILLVCTSLFGLGLLVGSVQAAPLSNPIHYVDTYWDLPNQAGGYYNFDVYVTPEADGSPDGYYFSSYFWFANDYPSAGGYLGLQTDGLSNPKGKAAIFSIWGGVSSSGPGYNQPFTEDGTGYTSRISYNWTINHTYRLRVWQTGKTGANDNWSAWVRDQTTGVETLIGQIVVAGNRGGLYPSPVTFHERYAGPTGSCSDLHLSQVTFTNLSANNGSVPPTSHQNVQADVPVCAGKYSVADIAGGLRTVIGGTLPAPPVTPPSVQTTSPPKSTPKASSPAPATTPPKAAAPTSSTTSPTQGPDPYVPSRTIEPQEVNQGHGRLFVAIGVTTALITLGINYWYFLKRRHL